MILPDLLLLFGFGLAAWPAAARCPVPDDLEQGIDGVVQTARSMPSCSATGKAMIDGLGERPPAPKQDVAG